VLLLDNIHVIRSGSTNIEEARVVYVLKIYVICNYWKQINGPSAQSDSTFMSHVPIGSKKMDQAREVILHLCHT
jgi:hypothetical protein